MIFRNLFSALNTRRRYVLSQGASDPILLYLSSGSFTRTTSGSYHNGTTSSLAWADPNVLRYEDRGDGLGALALLEGSRTNSYGWAREIWRRVNGTMALSASAYAPGPDGLVFGTRYSGSNQYSDFSTITKVSGTSYSHSVFARATSGGATLQFVASLGVTGNALTASMNEEWRRYDINNIADSTGTGGAIPIDARDKISLGGIAAFSTDVVVDMMQLEVGSFPSSFINVPSTTAITRGADVLTLSSGSVPGDFISGAFSLYVVPHFASTEIGSLLPAVIQLNGVGNYLLRFNGSRLQFTNGGAVNSFTPVFVWQRNERMLMTINLAQNVLYIERNAQPILSATWAPTSWTANNLTIGSGLFGRMSDIYRSGSLGL